MHHRITPTTAHIVADSLDDLVLERPAVRDVGPCGFDVHPRATGHRGQDQTLPVGEMPIHRGARHLRGTGHIFHRRLGDAESLETHLGRTEDGVGDLVDPSPGSSRPGPRRPALRRAQDRTWVTASEEGAPDATGPEATAAPGAKAGRTKRWESESPGRCSC